MTAFFYIVCGVLWFFTLAMAALFGWVAGVWMCERESLQDAQRQKLSDLQERVKQLEKNSSTSR